MMKKIVVLVILFTLIGGLFVIGCSSKAPEPLKIGVLLPLTGPEAVDSED